MRLMNSIRQRVFRTYPERSITYSLLNRTYSHLCRQIKARVQRASARINEERLPLDSNQECNVGISSDGYRIAYGKSASGESPSSSAKQSEFLRPPGTQRLGSRRCFSVGLDRLCKSSSGTADAHHRPKREGELLKYTNLLRSPKQRFILTPSLAKLTRELVWPGDSLREDAATIITANEGPGFMSRELLDNGASKVLALCRHAQFGPALEEIRSTSAPESFQWQHADLYQMQYIGDRELQPPVARVEDVFQDVDPVAWEEDVGVKVIGALPQDGERKQAYVLASLILERLSMFSYGRVQLNLFMSGNCYHTLIHPPGHMKNYRALSALYQVSCDIKLLHTESMDSFKLPRKKQPKSKEAQTSSKKLDDLYLVQITPKRDLFTRHQLEQWEAFIFVFFIRQALARRKERLHKIIDVWAPGSGDVIAEFGHGSRTMTGEVTGDDLLALFCRICKLDNFNGAWMGEEVMGWASGRPHDMNTLELSQALGSMNPT